MRFRLIPRDNGFYPLFEQQAAAAIDMSVQLGKLMASLPIKPDRVETIIAALRSRGVETIAAALGRDRMWLISAVVPRLSPGARNVSMPVRSYIVIRLLRKL